MKYLLNMPGRRANQRPKTPLNRKVDRLYRLCKQRGYHRPSGQLVIRDQFALAWVMSVCRDCGVPSRTEKAA